MPGIFKARTVETPHGTFGYIRIYAFSDRGTDPQFTSKFINEFIRLVQLLPQNGLIIDVRNNGGGYVNASEMLLQMLTPRYVKPEPAQFINTPLTYELCRRYPEEFGQWSESIRMAIETGAIFSQGFPLTWRKIII